MLTEGGVKPRVGGQKDAKAEEGHRATYLIRDARKNVAYAKIP